MPKAAQELTGAQERAKLVLVSERDPRSVRSAASVASSARASGDPYAMGMQTRRVVDQIESEITRQAIRRIESVEAGEPRTGKPALVYPQARSAALRGNERTWQTRARQIVRQLFGAPLPVDR